MNDISALILIIMMTLVFAIPVYATFGVTIGNFIMISLSLLLSFINIVERQKNE
jgi:uncharacterized membrane protein YesL